MWELRRLTTLRAFMGCYRDSFTLYLLLQLDPHSPVLLLLTVNYYLTFFIAFTFQRFFTTHGNASIEPCSPVKNVVYICYLYTPDDGRMTETYSVDY
jgi:hypothetical protein